MGTVFSFAVAVPGRGEGEGLDAGLHAGPDTGPARVHAAIDAAMRSMHTVDAAWSPYREDSLVGLLRRDQPAADPTGDLGLEDVLERCEVAWRVTGGAFDPWGLPGGFDPSGLVKGWAVERAVRVLEAAGLHDVAVGGGGDLVFRGHAPGRVGWMVGLRDPGDAGRVLARCAVGDAAVATSGIYERGRHVIDPRTGRTDGDLVAVTVVGPDLGYADAFATALLAEGRCDPGWLGSLPGYRALGVFADGRLGGDLFPSVELLAAP